MPRWTVVIETRAPGGGPGARDAFEITPPPEPGSERAVLEQLVTGIHPRAVERSHVEGLSTFADGARTITARFEVRGGEDGRGAAPGGGQGTLFDP